MASKKIAKPARSVPRLTLEQALDLHVFYDTWEVVPVIEAERVARDQATGKDVGMRRSGKSVGYSVQGAAKELKVSRQRIHQLLDAGVLKAYELLDDAKHPAALLITPASLGAFEASGRKPGRKRSPESKRKGK